MKILNHYKNLVSVIVVCYNEDKANIQKTLDSIISQTYEEIELIVIDGGSNKETIEAFNQYKTYINFFQSEPDNGIFDGMNKGVLKANGKWISFMNIGDFFFEPSSLTKLLKQAKGQTDIIYGDKMTNKNTIDKPPKKINKYVLFSSGICHQTMLIKRCLFEQVGYFDLTLTLGADPDWNIRAFQFGAVFQYVPITVCFYKGNGASENYLLRRKFQKKLVKQRFTNFERFTFSIRFFMKKIIMRIITLNFNVPFNLKIMCSKFKKLS